MYWANIGIKHSTFSAYVSDVALNLTVIAPQSNIYTGYVTGRKPTDFTGTAKEYWKHEFEID